MSWRIWIALMLMGLPVLAEDKEAELAQKVEVGNLAFEEAAYDDALNAYNAALEASPKSSVVHYNRGNVLFRQGKFDAAIEAYKEAAKHKPKKHLLRNIHFNLGNTYYRQAQKLLTEQPDKKTEKPEERDDGEPDAEDAEAKAAAASEASYSARLNQALGLFEDANNEYRTSLSLDRKISIVEGRELRDVGTYAKKNWALARKAWTEVREEIRKLERQNLKLRDGINSLLQTQRINLPRLETVYLQSFSEDALKYRLKVLAEYQIDNTDSLERLRELAVKDVERVTAELENHKSAVAAAVDPANPQQPQGEDPELARLEQAVNETTQIRDAVVGAAGLENFVVDALKRGKPLVAWRNLGQMVELLQELVAVLDRQDPVAGGYGQIVAKLQHAEQLRLQTVALQGKNASGPYADLGARSLVLAGEKLRTMLDGEDPAKQPGAFSRMDMILERLRKASQEAAATAPPAEGAPAPSAIETFYQNLPRDIMGAAIDEAKALNAASTRIVVVANEQLAAEAGKPVSVLDLPKAVENCQRATTLVSTAQQPISQLFTTIIGECDGIADRLATVKPDALADENLDFSKSLPLLDVLIFEFGVVQKKAAAESADEFKQLQDALQKSLASLKRAEANFLVSREKKIENSSDLAKFQTDLRVLRMTLLQGLLILNPDAAINLYFDRLVALQSRMADSLPTTDENWGEARRQGTQFIGEINQLTTLLQQFVDAAKPAVLPEEDTGVDKPPADPQIAAREKSLGIVRRASTTAAESHRFLSQKVFPKRDLLVKGLALDLQKARLAYQQKPGEATEALQFGIDWQGQLKEQNTEASAIAIQLGQDKDIGGYMARSQGDVTSVAGVAAKKIRELQDAAKQGGQTAPGAGGPTPGGQPGPQYEPETLDEALKLVQDAILEGTSIKKFLANAEFHNAGDKHDRVVDLLTQALELLKQDNEEQDQEQDQQDQQDQQQGQDQQQQNQQGQQDQQAGNEGEQQQMTPDQARRLLNQLNNQDKKDQPAKAKAGAGTVDTPRPW